MNTTNTNHTGLTDGEFLAAYASHMNISLKDAARQVAAAAAPLVTDAVTAFLSGIGSPKTASTYGTHLDRLVNGTGPMCDSTCAACRDPKEGFVCRCECEQCRTSRVSIPALGGLRLSNTTVTVPSSMP